MNGDSLLSLIFSGLLILIQINKIFNIQVELSSTDHMPAFAYIMLMSRLLEKSRSGQPSPSIDDCLMYFDSEDDFHSGCRNIGHSFQKYTHPDDNIQTK